jgi:hypothetical protein
VIVILEVKKLQTSTYLLSRGAGVSPALRPVSLIMI